MPEPLMKYYFPTLEASEESQRERGARFPPPFYLHLWWARRPLAGCRCAIASSVIKVNEKPSREFIQGFLQSIKILSSPKPAYNYSVDLSWIKKYSDIENARLLDVFAGGGSIPFEALRMGFKEVVAVEYNPIAYVMLKATLEYPLRYGEKLVKDVKKWATWLLQEAKERLAKYYPPHPEGRPTNYIWVKTYRCRCGLLVPALANPFLSKKQGYVMKLEYEGDKPKIRVVKTNITDKETLSNYSKAKLTCPKGHVIGSEAMHAQYAKAMALWEEQQLYGYHPAILAAVKLEGGKFVEPTEEMFKAIETAEKDLRERWHLLLMEDLVPTEKIPHGDKTREILSREMGSFYKLFNARQLLVHITLISLIREAYDKMIGEGYDDEYAKAVVTYLALAHGRLLDYNSAITTWDPYGKGSINHTFSRHAFEFGQDFGEGDLLTKGTGLLDWVLFSNTGIVKALERIVELLRDVKGSIRVVLGDAADPSLYVELGEFDYVITDPPYYANVQYCELSDFFYVWFKRSVGKLYPEAFSTELTPKEEEIVVNRTRGRNEKWFEQKLKEVLELVRSCLKPNGLAVFMYAHRSTRGLRVMLNAALEAGFKPIAVWGFASEQPRSIHIVGKAAVKTLLVIALEPREEASKGVWDAALMAEVKKAIEESVDTVLSYGLNYADALLMGMGTAFGVVGKWWPLFTIEGKPVDIEDVLRYASDVVSHIVLDRMVSAGLDPWSGMYLLARVVYGEPEYDNLRFLGYGFGVDHEAFIKRYCGKSMSREGVKFYSIKPLTEIAPTHLSTTTPLVDALAAAVTRYLDVGQIGAQEVFEKTGYRMNNIVRRFIEILLAEGEPNDLEKTALHGLLVMEGGNRQGLSHMTIDENKRKTPTTLDKFLG